MSNLQYMLFCALLGATAAALSGASAQDARPVTAATAHGPHVATLTAADSAALERGRALTRLLFDGQADALYEAMSETLRAEIGGKPAVDGFVTQVGQQLGEETERVHEEADSVGNVVHYDRVARYAGVPDGTVTTHWSWREDGRLIAAYVRPTPKPAPTPHDDYRTRTTLRLPFDSEWTVAWGGRTPHRNYHVSTPDQRFAYDLLVVRDGSTHEGEGTRNEDYHCFGEPILAPAPGQVVSAIDSLHDNVPGEMLEQAPAGNHVIVDHGEGEYSVLAHLRSGSVTVEAGDRVAEGDRIGTCGNSGNSSEPHLHYHLQDGPVPLRGQGLPAQFTDYVADGEPVARGEPVRGQRIRPGGGR